jgi:hypothetical protein
MTASELKHRVETAGHDRFFFTRDTMRFFGDRMSNYGVRAQPVLLKTHSGDTVKCWELYRRRPVKHGLSDSAYFDCQTLARRFGEVVDD